MRQLSVVEVARLGGFATLKKKGRKHYSEMAKKRWKIQSKKLNKPTL